MDRPAPASFAGTAKAALTRPTLSWSNKRLEVKSRWYRAKNRLSTLQLAQISSSFGIGCLIFGVGSPNQNARPPII